ncbi:hypothetical protein COU54_01695 [Candidatus Pacearchaeota archaeon CG10_big_fil_rev_8_21_14_0_10_31_24]|nr:MAG: hypothetical protein COU54_01695 [Candidatus Pacearchaeota archaeon CG10_big_fil_rev_8_21_14_0_10_31_24]
MNNKKKSSIVVGVVIILAILLVWGFIGSSEVAKIGSSCNFGINNEGNVLCWKWNRNVVGNIQDSINEILDK